VKGDLGREEEKNGNGRKKKLAKKTRVVVAVAIKSINGCIIVVDSPN
jgi:hypothetical protein